MDLKDKWCNLLRIALLPNPPTPKVRESTPPHSDGKVRSNRNGRDFGWEVAYEAVSRRPPIPLDTVVARTHTYTHAARVWDLSIVQGPFLVAPCPTRFATFSSLTR
jgi:hypothetical protein